MIIFSGFYVPFVLTMFTALLSWLLSTRHFLLCLDQGLIWGIQLVDTRWKLFSFFFWVGGGCKGRDFTKEKKERVK